MEEFGFEVAVDFLAEVTDVDVDDVGVVLVVAVVEVVPDLGAGDGLAGAVGEEFEEGVFLGGEGDGFTGAAGGFGGGVDGEVGDGEEGGLVLGLSADEAARAVARARRVASRSATSAARVAR